MRRWLALSVALIALVAAGFLWTRDRPVAFAAPPPAAEADPEDEPDTGLIAPRSPVTDADREARRFGRYDRDDDARISRDEYLANRKKAFAKLDANGDGRLGFDEYAAATVKKFGKADRNGDGTLAAAEFATTAVKRKAKVAPPCVPE
ncbi:MAG: histidine kinase [Alphaproteobacteria bacterium PA4]|nr:MAG: histidine kinase [Alphaproteobacteria bacterium PA4]